MDITVSMFNPNIKNITLGLKKLISQFERLLNFRQQKRLDKLRYQSNCTDLLKAKPNRLTHNSKR